MTISPATPAAQLRAAATKLRETRIGTTPPPWISLEGGDRLIRDADESDKPEYVVDEPMSNAANADWIALMHPGLSEPLAAWLDWAAREADMNEWRAPRHRCDLTEALAVARVINGGAS